MTGIVREVFKPGDPAYRLYRLLYFCPPAGGGMGGHRAAISLFGKLAAGPQHRHHHHHFSYNLPDPEFGAKLIKGMTGVAKNSGNRLRRMHQLKVPGKIMCYAARSDDGPIVRCHEDLFHLRTRSVPDHSLSRDEIKSHV